MSLALRNELLSMDPWNLWRIHIRLRAVLSRCSWNPRVVGDQTFTIENVTQSLENFRNYLSVLKARSDEAKQHTFLDDDKAAVAKHVELRLAWQMQQKSQDSRYIVLFSKEKKINLECVRTVAGLASPKTTLILIGESRTPESGDKHVVVLMYHELWINYDKPDAMPFQVRVLSPQEVTASKVKSHECMRLLPNDPMCLRLGFKSGMFVCVTRVSEAGTVNTIKYVT